MTIWIFIGVKEQISMYLYKRTEALHTEWKKNNDLLSVEKHGLMVFANITPIIFEDHCYLLEVDEA